MVRKSPTPRSIDVSASDLISYEAACKQEPILKSLDSILHQGTNRVIRSLANDKEETPSLSFSALKEVAGSLLEMNKEVVRVILDNKEDIWKNQSMLPLVELFFDSSANALDFCSCLENCLRRIKTTQLMTLQFAVQHFKEEVKAEKTEAGDKKFKKTLEELNKFKETEDAFPQTFFDLVFVAAFASVLILSVVAAAVTFPPVVTALVAALTVPMGSVGKWCDSLWKRYEGELKGQRKMVVSMSLSGCVTMKDLQNIRVLVKRFEIQLAGMKKMAEMAEMAVPEEKEMVRLAMREIDKELNVFEKAIEDIDLEVDKVNNFITMSRTVILRRIIDYAADTSRARLGSSS